MQYATPGFSFGGLVVLTIFLSLCGLCYEKFQQGELARFLLTDHPIWRRVHITVASASALCMAGVVWFGRRPYALPDTICGMGLWLLLAPWLYLMLSVGVRTVIRNWRLPPDHFE